MSFPATTSYRCEAGSCPDAITIPKKEQRDLGFYLCAQGWEPASHPQSCSLGWEWAVLRHHLGPGCPVAAGMGPSPAVRRCKL